jgi:hypothetical protein
VNPLVQSVSTDLNRYATGGAESGGLVSVQTPELLEAIAASPRLSTGSLQLGDDSSLRASGSDLRSSGGVLSSDSALERQASAMRVLSSKDEEIARLHEHVQMMSAEISRLRTLNELPLDPSEGIPPSSASS